MTDSDMVTAVTKTVLYACILIAIIFLSIQCQVDSKIIIECAEACDSQTTRMKSVTSRECECMSKTNSTDDWLTIPRP